MNFKFLLLFLFCTLNMNMVHAVNPESEPAPIQYEIVSAGSGLQGTYLVKVWVYDKKGNIDDFKLKYAAVHGVLFKGFSGKKGCPSQPPLVGNQVMEQNKADYFNDFFSQEGIFLNFSNIVDGSYSRTKLSKKKYKISAVVQVQKDLLRKEMERAGVMQSLSDGF